MDALCLQSGKISTLRLHLDLRIPVLAEPSMKMYMCEIYEDQMTLLFEKLALIIDLRLYL